MTRAATCYTPEGVPLAPNQRDYFKPVVDYITLEPTTCNAYECASPRHVVYLVIFTSLNHWEVRRRDAAVPHRDAVLTFPTMGEALRCVAGFITNDLCSHCGASFIAASELCARCGTDYSDDPSDVEELREKPVIRSSEPDRPHDEDDLTVIDDVSSSLSIAIHDLKGLNASSPEVSEALLLIEKARTVLSVLS